MNARERFDDATLRSLAETHEIDIRPAASGKDVTIWAVRAGNDIYVRSYKGEQGRWYRALREDPRASVIYSGGELEVRAEPGADTETNEAVNSAYLEKYRSSSAVGAMVTPEVAATTMRLATSACMSRQYDPSRSRLMNWTRMSSRVSGTC